MNPHVRLPLLGLIGLALLAPLSVSRAELSLIVETPGLGLFRGGADRHLFWGPGESGIHLIFTFDEAYTESYTSGINGSSYTYSFDVKSSSVVANGAMVTAPGGRGRVSAYRARFSDTYDYRVDFSIGISDPAAATFSGYTAYQYLGTDGNPTPAEFYRAYPIGSDPYFDAFNASVVIEYTDSNVYPEAFIKSFLNGGEKNETPMSSLRTAVISRRLDYSTTAVYDSLYQGVNWDHQQTRVIVAVPEPSTYGIAGVGLLALAALARGLRGRRRAA